jgi:hypothetical protein
MSPTCSNRDLAGRNALSATDLTIYSPPEPPILGRGPARHQSGAPEEYVMAGPFATHNPLCKTPGTYDSEVEWRE